MENYSSSIGSTIGIFTIFLSFNEFSTISSTSFYPPSKFMGWNPPSSFDIFGISIGSRKGTWITFSTTISILSTISIGWRYGTLTIFSTTTSEGTYISTSFISGTLTYFTSEGQSSYVWTKSSFFNFSAIPSSESSDWCLFKVMTSEDTYSIEENVIGTSNILKSSFLIFIFSFYSIRTLISVESFSI